VHQQSVTDSQSTNATIIEKSKETILYGSVTNEKLNQNLPVKRLFYEQITISLNIFY